MIEHNIIGYITGPPLWINSNIMISPLLSLILLYCLLYLALLFKQSRAGQLGPGGYLSGIRVYIYYLHIFRDRVLDIPCFFIKLSNRKLYSRVKIPAPGIQGFFIIIDGVFGIALLFHNVSKVFGGHFYKSGVLIFRYNLQKPGL